MGVRFLRKVLMLVVFLFVFLGNLSVWFLVDEVFLFWEGVGVLWVGGVCGGFCCFLIFGGDGDVLIVSLGFCLLFFW